MIINKLKIFYTFKIHKTSFQKNKKNRFSSFNPTMGTSFQLLYATTTLFLPSHQDILVLI